MFFFLFRSVCIFSGTEDFSSFWKPGCGQWANRTEEKEQKKYFFVALQGKVRCVSAEAKKNRGNVRNLIRIPRPHLHFPHLFRHSAIRNLFFASLAASVIEFLLQFSREILSCFSWKKREKSESTHTPFFIYCGSRFFQAPQAKAKQAGWGGGGVGNKRMNRVLRWREEGRRGWGGGMVERHLLSFPLPSFPIHFLFSSSSFHPHPPLSPLGWVGGLFHALPPPLQVQKYNVNCI